MRKLLLSLGKFGLMLATVLVYWAALTYAYMTYTMTQMPYLQTGHYVDGDTVYEARYIPLFALLTLVLFAVASGLAYGVYRLWRRPHATPPADQALL